MNISKEYDKLFYEKYSKYSKRAEVYNYIMLGTIVFIWIISFKLFISIGNNQSYETIGIIFALIKSIFCSFVNICNFMYKYQKFR